MGRINHTRYAKSWAHGLRLESWDSDDLPCGTKTASATDKFGRAVGPSALDNANRFLLDWTVTLIAKALDPNGEPLTVESELSASQIKLNDLEEVYVAERDEIKQELADEGCQLIDFGYIAKAKAR